MVYYTKENGQTVTTSTLTNNYIYKTDAAYTSSASAEDVLISTLSSIYNLSAPTAETYTLSTTRNSNWDITGSIIASDFTIVVEDSDMLGSISGRTSQTLGIQVVNSGAPESFYRGSYNVSLADGVWGVNPAVTESTTYTVSAFSRVTTYASGYYNSTKTLLFKWFKPSSFTVTTRTGIPTIEHIYSLFNTTSTFIDNPITISVINTDARLSTKATFYEATTLRYFANVNSWRTYSETDSIYNTFYKSITPDDFALVSATTMSFLGSLSTDVASLSYSTSIVTGYGISNLWASYSSTINSTITIEDNGATIFSTTSPVVSFTSSKTTVEMQIVHSSDYYTTTSSVESSTYFSFNEITTSYISLITSTYGSAGEFSFSTSTFSTSSSKETFTVEGVTSTIRAEVGSLYTNGNYLYSTTFYGTLEGNNVYMNSWVYSANVSTKTTVYENDLSKVTIASTDKLFGDPISSTSISETSVISSKVYTTGVTRNLITESLVKSSISTLEYVDAPIEYFTINYTYTSYTMSTEYSTSIGPKVYYEYDGDEGLDTSYDLDATVTEMGSWHGGELSTSSQLITSSVLNTSDYGTTYRLSELISSSSWVNIGNVNGTLNYRFSYDVDSMFSFSTMEDIVSSFITTLSNYTTLLATTYSVSYNTVTEALSYSFTATQSNTVKTTGERFIDKIEIYRTSTVGVFGRNTVAVFSGSTLDTISSRVTTESAISTSQDVSTVDRTFITSSADFTTDTELITQDTLSSVSNRFISSSSFIISTTYEQQNETLMFKTSYNKYSYYYNTSYYSTVDTIKLTISASTYESLYVPASFTTTSGYTSRSSTTGSYSSSTLMTSLSSYTTTWMPVYTTVDGVYITE